MSVATPPKNFPLGRILITPQAEQIASTEVTKALRRHARGDWGELCADDMRQNELALREGERLVSAYRDRLERNFFVLTEADRSATTVFMADEF